MTFEEIARAAAEGTGGPKTQIRGQGEHYTGHSPKPFAARAAEVKANAETGEFDVLRLVNAVDCGHAITPTNVRGQVTGGAIMGLGQAASEELSFDDDGVPEISGLRDYSLLRSTNIPPDVDCRLVETYEETGPFGAKSVGEVTNIGTPPAVANAVKNATEVRITSLPITATKIRGKTQPPS